MPSKIRPRRPLFRAVSSRRSASQTTFESQTTLGQAPPGPLNPRSTPIAATDHFDGGDTVPRLPGKPSIADDFEAAMLVTT